MTRNIIGQGAFAPPWKERTSEGELGKEYGPTSPQTWSKHLERYRNWAYRKPSKEAQRDDAMALARFVRLEDGSIREGIPAQEVQVYQLVYENGRAVRAVARKLELSRSTIRKALKRLRAREVEWSKGQSF